MNKTVIVTTLAALLASSAVPANAANTALDLKAGSTISIDTDLLTAQTDAGVGAGVDATLDASEDGVAVDTGLDVNANASANASDAADNTFGSVMASLDAAAAVDLSAVTESTQISVIALSSLQGQAAEESAALDAALQAHAEAHPSLHGQVQTNAAIMAKLQAEGYDADDVVALKAKADGSIIVYVDDRA